MTFQLHSSFAWTKDKSPKFDQPDQIFHLGECLTNFSKVPEIQHYLDDLAKIGDPEKKVFLCGVTLEHPDTSDIYYLEAMTKKTGDTWHLFGQNIKGFALPSDGPEFALICNIKNDHFVG